MYNNNHRLEYERGKLALVQLKIMVDEEKIKHAIKLIIEAIGDDVDREGLKETPDRIARMYTEIFSGMEEDAKFHLDKTFKVYQDEIILEKDIQFYSMCEHHLVPFYGKAHLAYIPDGRVAGLSKLARTVEVFAKRPQLQERMTAQIADALMEHLGAKGAMVILEAEHMCMTMRGVKKPGSKTVTVISRGSFLEDSNLRDEVYKMMRF